MNTLFLHLVAVSCLGATADLPVIPPNAVFSDLVEEGVPVPVGDKTVKIKLPPPIMSESMNAAEQAEALARTAAMAKTTTGEFIAKSSDAPLLSRIRTVHPNPIHVEPVCRTLDIAFVARGKWSVLTDPDFGKDILKAKKAAAGKQASNTVIKAGVLTDKELAARGLSAKGDIDGKIVMRKEVWLQTTFHLFDQAEVSAARHVMITKGPNSIVFAALLDPRFDSDAEYPNQWRAIDSNGKLGPVNVYKGAGFYIKATNLAQPKDAIFCEYHSIFYEPKGWFDGENLLSSKLPLAAKYQVKQFRIKLAKASEPEPEANAGVGK
jgi:hypothetical protein